MLRHPFTGHALGLGDLVGSHALREVISVVSRLLVPPRGSQVEPHVRGNVILRYATAFVVHVAEEHLRTDIALFGGYSYATR